jgi:hypothetical protein
MRRRSEGWMLGAYVLLTLVCTYPLVIEFTRAIPGDGFDGWQNYWNIWWINVALLQQHASPYFTGMLLAPTGVGLLFHTLNPFNGLLTLPAQLSWGLVPAYNVAVVFSFAVGGFGAYLLTREVLGRQRSRLPALAAGVIFTLSPFHVAHLLGHLQLISLEWIPFFALYLVRMVELAIGRDAGGRHLAFRPILRSALLAGLFLALVALCDWYYVLYCLILAALAVVWLLAHGMARHGPRKMAVRGADAAAITDASTRASSLQRPWQPVVDLVAGLAVTCLFFAAALSPVLVPMIREATQFRFMVPDPAQSRTFSADLLAFLFPQEFSPLWGAWATAKARVFTATLAEHQVFAGYTVLLLAIVGLVSARHRNAGPAAGVDIASGATPRPARVYLVSFWLLVVIVFGILALGPVLHVGGNANLLPGGRELPLPYGWLARTVPFLNISRSVSRFDVVVMLGLAVLAGYGLQWLSRHGKSGRGLAFGALFLIILEFWAAPYPMSLPDTPGWYTVLAADSRPGAVLNLPMNWDRPGYLLYQTVHGKPLAAAYISRDDPRTLVDRAPVLQHFRHLGPDIIDFDLAGQGRQVLSDLGVRWVVLDRYKMPGARERDYNEGTAHLIFGSAQPVHHDSRLDVYEVDAPAVNLPYLILGSGWEPFDPVEHSRSFTGRASVIVQAPGPGHGELRVTVAPNSGPLAGGPITSALQAGAEYVLPVEMQAGATSVDLEAMHPGGRVVVTRLALMPQLP